MLILYKKQDCDSIKLAEASLSPWAPKQPVSRQVAVLMSGGVDSSTTAYLLKQAGWDVLGITMKIPLSCDRKERACCGADAAYVCNQLDIPHYFIDVSESFKKLVIEPFEQSYANGLTPNPCVDCNTLLKFGIVWDFLEKQFGIKFLATGHYARITKNGDDFFLGRAQDRKKDQSYFLYGISRERLPYFILPLSEVSKQDVRTIAGKLNLKVADKPESMELCFAGQNDYRNALAASSLNKPGDLTDMQGNVIGTHKGIANYTIGQRRGLRFAGGKPLYVGRIDAKNNTVALGNRDEVCASIVTAENINILIPQEFTAGNRVFAKLRSYSDPHPCELTKIDAEVMSVKFDTPQFAPCPGQKLVLYNEDDNIIAGGTIVQGLA